jgi:hypothetical protein
MKFRRGIDCPPSDSDSDRTGLCFQDESIADSGYYSLANLEDIQSPCHVPRWYCFLWFDFGLALTPKAPFEITKTYDSNPWRRGLPLPSSEISCLFRERIESIDVGV